MCRARPGPRCSDGGAIRQSKALRRYVSVSEKYQEYSDAHGGFVYARLRRQMVRSSLRLQAARRVFDATPEGQKRLQGTINELDFALNTMPISSIILSRRTPAYDRYRSTLAERDICFGRLTTGIQRRQDSYADLAMVKDERSNVRSQSLARGGEMGPKGHPLSESAQANYRGEAARLNLKEWDVSDVSRAKTWVEQGASPDYVKNEHIRAPRSARDSEGHMIFLGPKASNVDPESKLVRVNTPDGQVIEGRHDIFTTKTSDGKYVVSLRSTVASSWEDAAPIDVTRQELGHIIKKDSNVSKVSYKSVVKICDTPLAAKRAVNKTKSDFDYAATTALMGRTGLVVRAGRKSSGLQRRGIVVWHRYTEPVV